jgi:hypothetical protein
LRWSSHRTTDLLINLCYAGAVDRDEPALAMLERQSVPKITGRVYTLSDHFDESYRARVVLVDGKIGPVKRYRDHGKLAYSDWRGDTLDQG